MFADNLILEAAAPEKVSARTTERFAVVDDVDAGNDPQKIHPNQNVDPAAVAVLGWRHVRGQVHVADHFPRRPVHAWTERRIDRWETRLHGETVRDGHYLADHLVVDGVPILGGRRGGKKTSERPEAHPQD